MLLLITLSSLRLSEIVFVNWSVQCPTQSKCVIHLATLFIFLGWALCSTFGSRARSGPGPALPAGTTITQGSRVNIGGGALHEGFLEEATQTNRIRHVELQEKNCTWADLNLFQLHPAAKDSAEIRGACKQMSSGLASVPEELGRSDFRTSCVCAFFLIWETILRKCLLFSHNLDDLI